MKSVNKFFLRDLCFFLPDLYVFGAFSNKLFLDYIVVGSDAGRIVILEYNAQKVCFERVHQETFGKTGCRRIVPGQYLAVDPKGRAILIGEFLFVLFPSFPFFFGIFVFSTFLRLFKARPKTMVQWSVASFSCLHIVVRVFVGETIPSAIR